MDSLADSILAFFVCTRRSKMAVSSGTGSWHLSDAAEQTCIHLSPMDAIRKNSVLWHHNSGTRENEKGFGGLTRDRLHSLDQYNQARAEKVLWKQRSLSIYLLITPQSSTTCLLVTGMKLKENLLRLAWFQPQFHFLPNFATAPSGSDNLAGSADSHRDWRSGVEHTLQMSSGSFSPLLI